MEKKITYLELVNETMDFYSADVSRRSVNNDGDCVYNGPYGEKCAFSRCTKTLTKKQEGCTAAFILENGTKILLEKYQHLINISFWDYLQEFHDEQLNWNTDGLTEFGIRRFIELKHYASDLDLKKRETLHQE